VSESKKEFLVIEKKEYICGGKNLKDKITI